MFIDDDLDRYYTDLIAAPSSRFVNTHDDVLNVPFPHIAPETSYHTRYRGVSQPCDKASPSFLSEKLEHRVNGRIVNNRPLLTQFAP